MEYKMNEVDYLAERKAMVDKINRLEKRNKELRRQIRLWIEWRRYLTPYLMKVK